MIFNEKTIILNTEGKYRNRYVLLYVKSLFLFDNNKKKCNSKP